MKTLKTLPQDEDLSMLFPRFPKVFHDGHVFFKRGKIGAAFWSQCAGAVA